MDANVHINSTYTPTHIFAHMHQQTHARARAHTHTHTTHNTHPHTRTQHTIQVIKGWTEAMQLMVQGDKWEMYIPGDDLMSHKRKIKYQNMMSISDFSY